VTVEKIEAVARRFFKALEIGDWAGAVSLMSSATLEGHAEAWKRRFEAEGSDSSLSLASREVRGRGPITPEQYNALLLGPGWGWRVNFPDVNSLEELLEASPAELAAMHLRTSLAPDRIGVTGIRWRVLGVALDGADEAHVVFRAREGSYESVDGEDVEPVPVPQLLRLSRYEGIWKCPASPTEIGVLSGGDPRLDSPLRPDPNPEGRGR
jgi:hypothetical protein